MDLQNWQSSQHLRWSFQHIAEFLPTAAISRGTGPVAALEPEPADLDSIPIILVAGGTAATLRQVIDATDTDGWAVMHRGKLVVEEYFGEMTAVSSHLLMSVSKSLVGAVAGALSDAGLIDVDAPITTYVPALLGSGYAGATVRHLLDMRSGIAFSENYLDPFAEVRRLEEAIGWAPRIDPGLPSTMYGYLQTLQQKTFHGGAFEYRSCETDVLGWVCEAAGGEPMPALMSRLLWSRIGAESDATIGTDQVGTGMFDGGINSCLRDLLRFGALFLNGGLSLTGEQVLSPTWVTETLQGDTDTREAFLYSPGDNRMPGGMYRNQLWFPYPGNDVLLCLGIHGQMIYINRPAGLVAAKLSSWPLPQDAAKLFSTIGAFDAIAAALAGSAG
ncbi:serine hydrolase [Arthrobacter sp. CJ23]|uniref:serine hydrolase domain-containing protein n=1 Tax=Arthrobacter sp. CJ23 TaxID=2972479 RepID=UPI00215D3632|nr:serine hydrolase [Arthrobacter sp. CJ23]UVJ40139.1 beta-lactamase family protein [Arthrobacter sp. CJ23]